MFLLRRVAAYYRDVVDTVWDVLAADDSLLCDCVDDRWCTDCALLADPEPLPWPTPRAVTPCDAA